MSKELDAWQEIKLGYICGQGAINEFALRENERENFKLIESTLMENLGLRKAHEFLREDYEKLEERVDDLERIIKEPDTTIKKLKALEIIEKKNVCIHDFKKSKTLKEYNGCRVWEEELTQEEYDILKEVLL